MPAEMPSHGGEQNPKPTEIFGEMDRGLQEGQIYLKESETKLAELATDLESAQAELETYVSGNEYAAEHNLKPMATREEIEAVRLRIQGIRQSVSNMEILQAKIISTMDKMEATEDGLLRAMLNNPTTEPNPDDK